MSTSPSRCLSVEPPFERLDVAESRLAARIPARLRRGARNAVPRTAVAGDRERHLGAPAWPRAAAAVRNRSASAMCAASRAGSPSGYVLTTSRSPTAAAARAAWSIVRLADLSALDPPELGARHVRRLARPCAWLIAASSARSDRAVPGRAPSGCAERDAAPVRSSWPSCAPARIAASRRAAHLRLNCSRGERLRRSAFRRPARNAASGLAAAARSPARHGRAEEASGRAVRNRLRALAGRAATAQSAAGRAPGTQTGRRRMPAARGT